jgi:3-dehydroshikimate dehydratase
MLSLCSIAFRYEPIEDLLPRIARAGFPAVEIFGMQIDGKSDTELQVIKAAADRAHVKILVLSPYFSFPRTQELYQESMARAEKFVHYCHVLDAPKIRTFIDVGPKGLGSAAATPEQWQQGVAGLKAITALDRSINFVVETHEKTLADTAASSLRIMQDVAAPNLKILFQPDTFIKEGILEAYDTLRPYIDHLHLCNLNAQNHSSWIEEGVIDYPAFFRHLKETNYQGSASLEYCHEGATWEKIESGYNYIKKHYLA